MRLKAKKASIKFLLGISLAVSLSGCSIFNGWDRTNYPKPSAKACFFNPQIADDIKGGEERWVIKEAAEKGIPPQIAVFTLIASLKELEMRNDPVPLEEIYAQMNPPALSHFLLGCATILMKEGKDLSADRNLLIAERNLLIRAGSLLLGERNILQGEGNVLQEEYAVIQKQNKIMQKMQNLTMKQVQTWKTDLNTAPTPPQASPETCSNAYGKSHPALFKAGVGYINLYVWQPVLQMNAIYDKIYEIANKVHEMDNETLPLANAVPLPPIPPSRRMSINQIESFELKDEQLSQKDEQLLQKAEQMKQKLQKRVEKLQEERQNAMSMLPQILQLAQEAKSRYANVTQALKEANNENNGADFIAIFSQLPPTPWRNFLISCAKISPNGASVATHTGS